jgi:hypothetical protein
MLFELLNQLVALGELLVTIRDLILVLLLFLNPHIGIIRAEFFQQRPEFRQHATQIVVFFFESGNLTRKIDCRRFTISDARDRAS